MIEIAPEPESRSVTFPQCNVRNFAVTSNLLDNPQLKYLFIIFILFCGVVRRGGP